MKHSFHRLTALSPIDGRYRSKSNILRPIFSEFGLMRRRVEIEIRWFLTLSKSSEIQEVPRFEGYINDYLDQIIKDFDYFDALSIKNIEKKINHDVKAVEYFLKKKMSKFLELEKVKEFIHFACTSEDINNLAYALMIKEAREKIIIPSWKGIIEILEEIAFSHRSTPILSRTHGRPATPSTVGKEFMNVVYRMGRQLRQMSKIKIYGKMNGTVGNYNAHLFAYPKVDWYKISEKFVCSFGIYWNPLTTQVEPYDYIAEIFDCIARLNTILIDFNRDMWGYICLNYFDRKIHYHEVGSSIMPYKNNPIDFENSEGNLELANALSRHIVQKIPTSRWQRDLSNSTLMRNLGVCIAHSLIAYQALNDGLKRIYVNKRNIFRELDENWQVITEAIQTILRKYGEKDPYEKLKEFSQKNEKVTRKKIIQYIDSLKIPASEKRRLKLITPKNYLGLSKKIVLKNLKKCKRYRT
ncbi:adenylosuccinate lyase [Candidatus Riesia pediculischaeffi]|uniref:Adenylosuccinate lyase n=1 Tax=Candidatus Riesia pediculischaeffi PTSU TaxID=1401651 RepID=A0A0C1S006_9ENTR|nr:adenylosuccinate lyase [Candidatus Riesia pediculischaeffi]KIE63892.1 Adenylosuccinate lyase [Candidatus Riesia pediculischaeffi PTSU]